MTKKNKKNEFPFGLYDKVLLDPEKIQLQKSDQLEFQTSELEKEQDIQILIQSFTSILQRILKSKKSAKEQVELINKVIPLLSENADSPQQVTEQVLQSISSSFKKIKGSKGIPRPQIRLTESDLITNAHRENSLHSHINSEIPSSNRIDLICSFIKVKGITLYRDRLIDFVRNGGNLRVLTTVYMGATERKAIDRLIKIGAQVKISYDKNRTRLHAKAWLFHRDTGFSTAYIGSSNLSHSAQVDGLEWNVRLSKVHSPDVIEKFYRTFESYWKGDEFEEYTADKRDQKRLDEALLDIPILIESYFDINPYPFQKRILEQIETERSRHGRNNNLIVAATGTGKTIMAALDYKRLLGSNERPFRLLFVAHREEILDQSLKTFRNVLRDSNFGEKFVGGVIPSDWNHVFASIQSLSKEQALNNLSKDRFDMIIVDEFHHAKARTYERILNHFTSKFLLGLTATPERGDGKDILGWFDGKIAAELRLWDAIDQNLLVPFHYYGVSDGTDLSSVSWKRGRYSDIELTNIFTSNDIRAKLIFNAIHDYTGSLNKIKALGFCVGVDHAKFMAKFFNKSGIPALAVTGKSGSEERLTAKSKLRNGEVKVLFTVDLYNEGVDIPEVNTVLFLRPTESLTVFIQQLGRGLRLHKEKSSLTVLDFIGGARREFRFDLRYQALLGEVTRKEVEESIDSGFPKLPHGCAIQLDRESQDIVLQNIRQALKVNINNLTSELKIVGDQTTLREFLNRTGLNRFEFYTNTIWWTELRRKANFEVRKEGSNEGDLGKKIQKILHLDDFELIEFYIDLIKSPKEVTELSQSQKNQMLMLLCILYDKNVPQDLTYYYEDLLNHQVICEELLELFELLKDRVTHLGKSIDLPNEIPLKLHCHYSWDQIFAAIGDVKNNKLYTPREGVYNHKPTKSHFLFVTIDKNEKDYTPTTMYEDYAISEHLFHWQSQNKTGPETEVGKDYINHEDRGIKIFLFIRKNKKTPYKRTAPYVFLGPAKYVKHEGAKPMNITWQLKFPLPQELLLRAKFTG